jgi:hypothetical protein
MELEVRTSKGFLYGKYNGEMANIYFNKLLAEKELFKLETRKLGFVGSDDTTEYLCFVAITDASLCIAIGFTLYINENDYIKVIR